MKNLHGIVERRREGIRQSFLHDLAQAKLSAKEATKCFFYASTKLAKASYVLMPCQQSREEEKKRERERKRERRERPQEFLARKT